MKKTAPVLYCLLPVRNGANTLRSYLDRVRTFCTGVIALDDGSIDATRDILHADPLVHAIMWNPPRPTYAGWNDYRNRSRLLEACSTFSPDWIIWLDADEFVIPSDIRLLTEFLATNADSSCAYGLEVLRLIGDETHFDRGNLWSYRLLAYQRGYQLPEKRLHFEPIPIQIPPDCRVKTRLRIGHLAGLTARLRRNRYNKYLQADPNHEYQSDYSNLLERPGHCWEIRPLPDNLPLLLP